MRNDRGGDRANRRADGARGARDENLWRRRAKAPAAFQFRRGRAPSDEGGGAGLGVSLSGEAAAGGAAFVDATTRLQTAVHGAGLAFAELFAPALTSIANGLSKVVSKIATFARECPVLSGGIALVVGAFGALATAATTWNVVGAAVGSSLTALGKTFGLLKVAAVASCKVIATALSFLSAHPVLAVVAAIGTAVVALKGYQAVRDAALGRNAWSDEAAQALEAGNAMREQDEGRLQRLQELAEKQALTKTEIAEAVSLAAVLKSRYGDVGVEVDALTGKIKIASGAQAELNKRMLEARRKETQAALDEARANAGDGVIERKIAEEEVGWDEALIGKKRGQSWSDWAFKDWSWHDSTADAKVAIAEGDENYQRKVAAAKAKNAAEIEKLEAELAGLDAVLNAPVDAASAPGTSGGSGGEASGVAAVDGKIAEFLEASAERVEDADLSPFDRKRDEIRDRGEALKYEMRKALDPDGVVDWSNADSIWNFLSSRPDGAAQLQAFNDRTAQIDAATNAELAVVDEEERKKANEDATKAAQEATKKEEAALQKVADFEAKRAEEKKSNAEKRIDAIRKETAEYQKQLQVLFDLE
ncbi:MAG: phage tail tape measure protein, partial [Thermoguttaceae bacterium]|nr:phage tail tape measure protein [Thermoguttaceae bacterium]